MVAAGEGEVLVAEEELEVRVEVDVLARGERLQRADAYEVDDPRLVTIVNDGSLDDAAAVFLRLLARPGWTDAALRRA